ncbi:TPA: ead/Ea22-like family protein [Klebsiella pneumoniae]|nr:ead/Ea22-like family protein [Klebsiella pneumoniae]
MTDITELAPAMKAAAIDAKELAIIARYSKGRAAAEKFYALANPNNVIALVEALEKSEKTSEARREAIDRTHNMFVRERDRANAAEEALQKAQTINAAAEKLVRCKGRYHSEQNYRALAALFGVTTPDLPPLEHENVHYADAAEMEIEALCQRIAELEREQEHLRPVGVMSEQAFHRLENRECRFIALWPRPGIFLPRKRPEDGVIVYARTAAAAGIKVEAE